MRQTALVDFKACRAILTSEGHYQFGMTPKQLRNGCDRLVPCAQPDHFRRRAEQSRHFGKISILGHDRELVWSWRDPTRRDRQLPLTPKRPNPILLPESVSDRLDQLEAEVLVEQQLYVDAVTSRLSRSAAYARQARISSSVNSGKSSRICRWVWPAASQPSTSATAIRI